MAAHDLVIRGGLIVDVSGAEPFKGDVVNATSLLVPPGVLTG
jgi:hypothetical protein